MSSNNEPKPAAKAANGKSAINKGAYRWKSVHDDLEKGLVAGQYGGCNAPWFGLAEIRAGVDMRNWHGKRSADEFYLPEIDEHVRNPKTQQSWDKIATFDPLGLYAGTPTMAATRAHLNMPELNLEPDENPGIVNEDGSINITKVAVDYAWNLPMMSERLNYEEELVRKHLHKWTNNNDLLDNEKKVFLPPLGGLTVYLFGDPRKLSDNDTEVAVRVHDSCAGSDVFGTDICTCRPYLVFAVSAAVDCAKRGGVGVVVYFQKEGRSLGEVTKYRVYNARKNQKDGDCAEKYFFQTESIAGIRDARFQEMMPDVLHWLGIRRIDWMLSMSNEKYDAITQSGIEIMQRVALPDMYVPADAHVEITAKIASGYHTDTVESETIIAKLRKLETVRERCHVIFDMAKAKKTRHFGLDLTKMDQVADFVIDVTKKAYPDAQVPYHSRWRHFDNQAVTELVDNWPCDATEKARRKLDLAFISVLLDAGAGPNWKYIDHHQKEQTRSEGLAIASFDMFANGLFSSDVAQPHRVNSHGLRSLTTKKLCQGFQASKENPMVGLDGRRKLLSRLAHALEKHPEFFGHEICRPGNIVDYVLKNAKDGKVSINVLWKAVIEGLETIWPQNASGVRRGDVWVYSAMKQVGQAGSDMIPFHKLSQWLTYSLLEPLEQLGLEFTDMDLLTGLAEYRNGGLFVDMGVLLPRQEAFNMEFDVGSEMVVEWRALTLILLDELADLVRKKMGKSAEEMPLAKILQGGTWAAGRVVAGEKRKDRSPPIRVRSDGTVF